MKQVVPFVALSLMALTGLYADENACGCPPPAAECQPSCSEWPMFDPNRMNDSCNLWLDGEVLYWQSHVGSLEYGIESNSSTSINGDVKHPHFDWDWGFRLGLGYKLPHDKWDLFINYTYVQGEAHGHGGGSGNVIFPSWANPFGFGGSSFFANEGSAHWNMNLNMGDIELGRNCFVCKWLTIRPFMGVRGLCIDQDYHVTYTGGTVAPTGKDHVYLDTDFWGVGLRMGFNTLWGLGKGIGIYGNGSASLLSGHFDVREKEKGARPMHITRDVDNVVPVADLALGLQWDYLFSADRYHFGVKLGWEFNMFFDQNQLFNFMSATLPGSVNFKNDDLSFQGVTLGFRFDF
jgi:hypothetical protein